MTTNVEPPLNDCLTLYCQRFPNDKAYRRLALALNARSQTLGIDEVADFIAQHALKARIEHCSLDELSEALLPCIIFLAPQGCALVLSKNDDVYELQTADGALLQLSSDELSNAYQGYSLLLSHQHAVKKIQATTPKQWFWSIIAKHRSNYIHVGLCAILINLFALAMPLFVMNVYDRVVPNQAFETLWSLAAGVLIILVFDFGLKTLRSYLIELSGKQADLLLSSQLFEHVMHLPLSHKPGNSSILANQLDSFRSVRDFFTSATLVTLTDLPFVLLFLLVIASISSTLVIIPLIFIPLILLTAILLELPLRATIRDHYRLSQHRQALIHESLSGIESIKALQTEQQSVQLWQRQGRAMAEDSMRIRRLQSNTVNSAAFFQQLITVFMICAGVYMISKGELSVGGLIACVAISSRAIAPFNQLSNLVSRYQQAQLGLNCLSDILNLPSEKKEASEGLELGELSGRFECSHIQFHYPNQKRLALDNIDLQIKAGEKLAILGPIGSGKSTLLRLLMGLYPPTGGLLRIDGLHSEQLPLAVWRSQIAFLGSEDNLFAGSLRENLLSAYPKASDEELLAIIDVCGLSKIIEQHESGLDLVISENGAGLSSGQKQAILLARCLIKPSSIILLDEPTSRMDSSSELAFLNKLGPFIKNKTFIMVTHKTSLLPLVDRLIILDQGKKVADGNKDSVLSLLQRGTS